MDCLFEICSLVVGLVGVGFSATLKTVAAKFLDTHKTAIKICRNKKPFSNIFFVIEKA